MCPSYSLTLDLWFMSEFVEVLPSGFVCPPLAELLYLLSDSRLQSKKVLIFDMSGFVWLLLTEKMLPSGIVFPHTV